jgi:hypothetical protein
VDYTKYPRTWHLPDSPNRGADGDHAYADYSSFEGREVVVTEKLDGGNTFGRHSIAYDALPSYFQLFAIYDAHDTCLSWDDTSAWAERIGVGEHQRAVGKLVRKDHVKTDQHWMHGEVTANGLARPA